MGRQAKQGLSKHATKGYRISIGKRADGNGYRTFWLGQQRAVAEYHADVLRGQFAHMQQQGRDVWTDEDVQIVDWYVTQFRTGINAIKRNHIADVQRLQQEGQVINAVFGDVPPKVTAPTAPVPVANMLHATMDQYIQWFEAKADRSASSKARLREVINGAKKVHPDIAVSKIDRLWIDSATQHWKNRPKHRKTGKQISTYTVKTVLQHLSQFFGWMADNEEATGFNEPKRMPKLFKYKPAEIDEIDQLTFDEIGKLYSVGTDQHRLYLLAGIFCGMTQMELAVTTKDEFNLDACIWNHRRHKTGVRGSHWLCPELADLIKARLEKTPPNDGNLAFLTHERFPLVTYKGGKKLSDSVKQAWDDLLEKAELTRRPTFKMCRKFAAQWMRDRYGEEMAQVALQQKPTSVLSKHYAKRRVFDPLHEAQRALYAELKAAKILDGAEKNLKAA